MPEPACNAPIAPILMMRAARELRRCGIAVDNSLERKSAGNIDQRVDSAEMSGGGVDRFFRLCCISQVDAAELDPFGCCRELRRSMIDTSHSRTPRKGFLGDHLAKRAQRTGDDSDFTLHKWSPCE